MIGVATVVAAATYACASRFKARSVSPISRKFYKGGFKPQMTRREAALILGVSLKSLIYNLKSSICTINHMHHRSSSDVIGNSQTPLIFTVVDSRRSIPSPHSYPMSSV
ncbi:unnamed protein product [Lactuca virosa]|uniref:Uncharacterized protein n=1 Tax=Lactuca virosa TaxID=75947 RepID=A0AAU9PRL5_9ASTR|nr:unnamed protein product [Lactuca virosa]